MNDKNHWPTLDDIRQVVREELALAYGKWGSTKETKAVRCANCDEVTGDKASCQFCNE